MCVETVCSTCGKPVSTNEKTCPHCDDGQPLDCRTVQVKKCPECGQNLNIRQKICPNCGRKVELE